MLEEPDCSQAEIARRLVFHKEALPGGKGKKGSVQVALPSSCKIKTFYLYRRKMNVFELRGTVLKRRLLCEKHSVKYEFTSKRKKAYLIKTLYETMKVTKILILNL